MESVGAPEKRETKREREGRELTREGEIGDDVRTKETRLKRLDTRGNETKNRLCAGVLGRSP